MPRHRSAGRSALPPWAGRCDWSRIRPASRPSCADTAPRGPQGVCRAVSAGNQADDRNVPVSSKPRRFYVAALMLSAPLLALGTGVGIIGLIVIVIIIVIILRVI